MFRIRFARGALDDLKRLRARDRVHVVDEIQHRLAHEPQEPDRNRKELAGLVPPWEHVKPVRELRIGDHRVFYDVDTGARLVIVRAIRHKGRSTTKEIV
jgi:mRNA-degrading endonuclease RelE of RelBE toxin-antitoxin system